MISIKKHCLPDGLTQSLYWNANSRTINQHKYVSSLTMDNRTVFLICMTEFFKKLKLYELLKRLQFQVFEKLTSYLLME